MKRFIEGSDREQGMLFPEHLADFVDEDNPVRVVDAFVGALDLGDLGFSSAVPAARAGLAITHRCCSRFTFMAI